MSVPGADVIVGIGKASASTRVARKSSVSQAPIEGLTVLGDSMQSGSTQETGISTGHKATALNQCTDSVPRSELRERISAGVICKAITARKW